MRTHKTEVDGITSTSPIKFISKCKPLAIAITLAMSTASHAATFTVTNTNDSGPGSLRQAVIDANNTVGADNVLFSNSLNGLTISLSSGQIEITDELEISGPTTGNANSISIDGNRSSRIFRSSGNVVLENLTLKGGKEEYFGGAISSGGYLVLNDSLITGNTASFGGGISSGGTVTLNRSVVSGNTASFRGGGITSSYASEVILNNSTVSGNTAPRGGGIYSYYTNLTLSSSTVSNNSADGGGGGGIFTGYSNLNITQSTISGNSAFFAGGIQALFVDINIDQSTITNNSSINGAGGIDLRTPFDEGEITNTILSANKSAKNNFYKNSGVLIHVQSTLFGDVASEIDGNNVSNVFSNAPGLSPLSSNGGYTQTHLPISGSLAINNGSNSSAPDTVDQRGAGFPRIFNGTVDIGATERQSSNPEIASLTLVKSITNDDGGSAVEDDFVLTASGPTPISGASGSTTVTRAAVQPGNYTLSEITFPGYSQTDLQCIGNTDSDLSDGLTLVNEDAVTCTFYNDDQPAFLTLVKAVVNDDGGTATTTDFTLHANGASSISGVSGSSTVTNAPVSAGNYNLSEEYNFGGYRQNNLECIGGSDTYPLDGLSVANGENITCTFENDDFQPSLTLTTIVINDDGGTATENDWVLSATGPVTLTGRIYDPSISYVEVPIGTYTLNAIADPINYQITWECIGVDAPLVNNQLLLAVGDNVICTATMNDISPEAIPTLSLTGLLSLISAFAAFFGWRQSSMRREFQHRQ